MTRVLVTGAAGFLGAAVVDSLAKDGHKVRALMHRPCSTPPVWGDRVEILVGDIRNGPEMKKAAADCDTVVHFAGKAHAVQETASDLPDYQTVNVEGTRNVLEGAVCAGVRRVIFASSVKVFGEGTSSCVDESYPPDPKTPYALSKWKAEQLLQEYKEKFGLEILSFRLPLVYGPTEKGNLYRMLVAIDRGWFPPLPKIGNRRSMLHIGNLLQAVGLAITAVGLGRSCYIVADREPYSVRTIYDNLLRGLGKPLPRFRVPLWALKVAGLGGDIIQTMSPASASFSSATLEKLIGSAWYSTEAICREMNYCPTFTFNDAVPELVAAYRAGSL